MSPAAKENVLLRQTLVRRRQDDFPAVMRPGMVGLAGGSRNAIRPEYIEMTPAIRRIGQGALGPAHEKIKPQFFPVKPPTNEVGVVIAKDAQGEPLLIEVLRYVHGVSNEELREPIYTVALGAVQVRLPSPIALFQAKVANVADIAQAGRQDARHVIILARLLPAYLSDLQRTAIDGGMTERQLIDYLERLLGVVTAAKAKKVLAQLNVAVTDLFVGLGDAKLPKLAGFFEKAPAPRAVTSLTRWHARSAPLSRLPEGVAESRDRRRCCPSPRCSRAGRHTA